jgi:aspartate kinase
MSQFPGLIVQKFGGATLADPAKIKHAAQRVAVLAKSHPLIVVVSAMGNTTNSLIDLANKVSTRPHRRELDMLLTAGERMSMSLLSMALNDLGCPAISFTGSQAGIMTDESHANAFIQDVKPIRVVEALEQKKVVILAGFQGVSPKTKEITTLGRGGSDTTAVAMAAHFKALRCDILKEVPSVFTADPRKVSNAKPLHELSYQQLADMTFWGAKVLHYKSAEWALKHKVPMYVGPASDNQVDFAKGTLVSDKISNNYKSGDFVGLNSHENVLLIETPEADAAAATYYINKFLNAHDFPPCQILNFENKNNRTRLWLTGPGEIITPLKQELVKSEMRLDVMDYATVTMTCAGAADSSSKKFYSTLEKAGIQAHSRTEKESNLTALISSQQQTEALKALHQLIK